MLQRGNYKHVSGGGGGVGGEVEIPCARQLHNSPCSLSCFVLCLTKSLFKYAMFQGQETRKRA